MPIPQAEYAEKGVLCSTMLSADNVMDELSDLMVSHFYVPAHQHVWSVMRELWDARKPIDFITITQRLRDLGQLEAAGGAAAISELNTFVPMWSSYEYYADIVRDKYLRRQMIQMASQMRMDAYEDSGPAEEVLQRGQELLFGLEADNDDKCRMRHWKDDVIKAVTDIEKRYKSKGSISGLQTGFGKFDGMTDGLKGSQFMVIAARPGQGKTALMMAIANHMAVEEKKSVAIFSLEMSADQLASRVVCLRSKLNLQRVRDGFLSDLHMKTVIREAGNAAKALVFIDDTPDLKLPTFYKLALRAKRKYGVDAILIDYVQLLRSVNKRAQDNRAEEISDASRMCKKIAKVLNIPVIGLAQLGRDADSRGVNSRPKISDLKGSGQIEQDADIIALLFRPNKDKSPDEEEDDDDLVDPDPEYAQPEPALGDGEIVEWIVAKHRDGPTDTVLLRFLKEFTRFENLNGDQETAYNNGSRFRQKKKRGPYNKKKRP